MTTRALIARIQSVLTPDLLSKTYRYCETQHRVAGHCYIAAEALYHQLGGKAAGLTPQVARDPEGGKQPPYDHGPGAGFLTRHPSRRARLILQRAGLA